VRPYPPYRHWLAAGLLALVSAGSVYFAWNDWRADDAQWQALTAVQKQRDGDLYPADYVFGPSAAWRFQSPAFLAILRGLDWGTGDLAPFRLLVGAAVLIYLGGMYALLFWQTRSWSVSTFVAILSMTVIHGPGDAFWGVGSLSSITPYGVVTAFAPLAVLAYLRQKWRLRRLMAVFAGVGLLANLDVSAAGNLTIVLLFVRVANGRFRPRAWLETGACAAAALLCAAPTLWHRWVLASRLQPAGAEAAASVARVATDLGDWKVLYPGLLDGIWTWLLPIVALLVISAVMLTRGERFQARNFAAWAWWIAGSLGTAFVLQGAAQAWGWARGRPAAVGYAGASALVMLPLYVLLAHALTTLFRIYRSHRALARWACGFFAAVWMLPSDNCRALRHAVGDTATIFMREQNKPRYVQKHHEKHGQWIEMTAIADWLRRSAPPSAIVVCDWPELRFRSRRSLLAARGDVEALYRHEPWLLGEWAASLDRQEKALHAAQARTLDAMARDLAGRPPRHGDEEWYVVLNPADSAVRELPAVPADGWGRYYVLCRLR
jgi:hypothetical protein